MVATDGHRLSLAEQPLEGDFGLKKGVILPEEGALSELRSCSPRRSSRGEEKPEGELGFAENTPSSAARAWCW